MSNHFDVIVIGGGIVGLSAAIAMRQRKFSVALIDAGMLTTDTSSYDPRVYAINRASQSLLQTLNVWQNLDQTRLSPYQHMHVWDAANGSQIDFDARMVGLDRLGTILEESVIKQALLQHVSAQNITTIPTCRISAVQSTPEAIAISNGAQTWHAKLLIVADGASSAMRQLLGVSLYTWSYHQNAIVTNVQTEHPHQQTAYQVFNADGPLAFLPLANPHHCSIVWSLPPSRAAELLTCSDDDFVQSLSNAFASKLGHCTLIGKRYSYPLQMRHAKQYSGPRWLLMGDAAHTIHPLAGLGLNVGLADVTAWLATIDASKSPAWSNKNLGAYQRHRKYAVWQMVALMDALKAIFMNPLPPIAAARGLGISVCDRFLPLKRLFIEQAAGTAL